MTRLLASEQWCHACPCGHVAIMAIIIMAAYAGGLDNKNGHQPAAGPLRGHCMCIGISSLFNIAD